MTESNRAHRKSRVLWAKVKALFGILFITILGGIAGDTALSLIQHYLLREKLVFLQGMWILFGISAALLPIFVAWLYSLSSYLLSSKASMRKIKEKREVLIMGLSSITENELEETYAYKELFSFEELARTKEAFGKVLLTRQTETLARPPRWQQNIRSVAHHLGILKKIIIIPPKPQKGQLEDSHTKFRDFLQSFNYPALENITIEFASEKKVDYNDYNDVYESITDVIDQEERKEKKICIDATPGLKPFSMAASIATLNSKSILLYVTNEGEIKLYDLSISTGDLPTG